MLVGFTSVHDLFDVVGGAFMFGKKESLMVGGGVMLFKLYGLVWAKKVC